MQFDEYKLFVEVIDERIAKGLREKYIERFIDINSSYYKKNIKKTRKYVDGYCYKGYLWDCLKEPYIIDEEYIKRIAKEINEVYVMWDIHTKERIHIDNYWNFLKKDIIKGPMDMIIKGDIFLPEDYYIFSTDMSWCIIKTHEEIEEKRYCLKCGNI